MTGFYSVDIITSSRQQTFWTSN